MNRKDLQWLAELRVREAGILVKNGCYEGAYYLAGYAVECALKACIAKQIREHDFPDRKFILDSYTHDLEKLLSLSGLRDVHTREAAGARPFALYWAAVRDWSEQDRYAVRIPEHRARNLFLAVTHEQHGVLQWLKRWW